MEYYNHYIEDKNILINSGIFLKDKDGIMSVNNEIIIENNRAIIGDVVYIHENKVINVKERSNQYIVGILDTESHIKYGMFKDKPLHLFKPTDKKYEYFYVPYRNEKKGSVNKKIYCLVQFKQWNVNNKHPYGTLIEIIGPVGNIDSEYDHLLNYYFLRKNTWKLDKKRVDEDLCKIETLQKENHYDYTVFSIDPLNSIDIDDAFHFIAKEDYYEIGIHIANPNIFFKEDIKYILEERITTVYAPNRKYNMLPNIYADNICSLLEGKKRYALSFVFKIDMENQMIESCIKQTVVFIEKNYDYDSFDLIINEQKEMEKEKKKEMEKEKEMETKRKKGIKKNLLKFMNFTASFFDHAQINSHELVEKWMIYTNKYIANYLIENKYKDVILRVHQNSKHQIEDPNYEKELTDYLNIYGESSAYYELYKTSIDSLSCQTHDKMNNSYYTHYTSPIRRSIDMYIHSLLINDYSHILSKDGEETITKINHFIKLTRKMGIMCKRLEFLNRINNEMCITYGYIVKIGKYNITLYLPEYKLEEKIVILPFSFRSLYSVEYEYEEQNSEKRRSISYMDENNKLISYKLYEKKKVQLWVLLKNENIFDKLTFQLYDEN